jgi:hypothetical protein
MILVSIIYASCDQSSSVPHKFHVNQRSNRILSPELILLVLRTTLGIKINVAFEHALHHICIWEAWVC